jgi:DNA-binding winged helix-turn-helix (wHTH) protein
MARTDDSARRLPVDVHERTVALEGREIDLTSREFEIVRRLATHPGWVFSAEQLCADDGGADYSPESVSVLVSRLRRKLADAGAPDLVETVREFGYRMRRESRETSGDRDDADAREALLDASWRLQEAVVRVERTGACEQMERAAEVLEAARHSLDEMLDD